MAATRNIGFATCRQEPLLTADDRLVLPCAGQKNLDIKPLIWDETSFKDLNFDCVVVRSCWDYHFRSQEFLKWLKELESCGIKTWNPAHLIEWNHDKFYLKELAEKGIKIPPTAWVKKGEQANLLEILEINGWEKAVVKPTISATAWRTWIVDKTNAAARQPEFEETLKGSGAIVQSFVKEIQSSGEWSLVFFNNEYSHAVIKKTRVGDFRVQEQFGGRSHAATPSTPLIEKAERVLDTLGEKLLFARIDGVETENDFSLMELEAIEPVLFLSADLDAPERFASAIEILSQN